MSVVYGLKQQAKALSALVGEQERSRFLVGTYDLNSDNQIHLIDFDEDSESITSQIYTHADQITGLSCCPYDSHVFAVCHISIDGMIPIRKASILEMEDVPSGKLSGKQGLELTNKSTIPLDNVRGVHWDPSGAKNIMAFNSNSCVRYSLGEFNFQSNQTFSFDATSINCGAWNLHDTNQYSLGSSQNIMQWDTRSKKDALVIPNAHDLLVRGLDYNPNKSEQLASCGDDCRTRIWDLRNPKVALRELCNHTHWVWDVSFNPSHDQLLLTCGSDYQVNLHSVVSTSSVPQNTQSTDDEPECKTQDGIVETYEQHEESVYSVRWSSADPWLFASLSYDGRLLINAVPREHKYKIIL